MKYKVNVDPRIFFPKIDEQVALPAIIKFTGSVSEESALKFRNDLILAENLANKSGQEIIPVIIDSYGGDVYALLSMMDAVESCEIPIATIVEGKAMSAGGALFTCGVDGHRYIGPSATVMIHEAATGMFHSKNEEFKAQAEELDRLNEILLARMSKNCGHKKNYFKKLIHERGHSDWYLNAEECVEHNLANHPSLPTYTVDVKITQTFGLPTKTKS